MHNSITNLCINARNSFFYLLVLPERNNEFSEDEVMFDIFKLIFTVDLLTGDLFNGTIKTRL